MSNLFVAGGAGTTSSRDDWETPAALFNVLNLKYRFTLDPCATADNAKCARYFTREDDGLAQTWAGERVFVNPPYGRAIGEWARKCCEESRHAIVVGLFPARTETAWFHDHIYHVADVEFLRGRVKFERGGRPLRDAPFPSMIVRWW